MATITRENIGLLNDKLTVQLSKEDYFPAFEKSLKTYAKTANIPGFRKGMVPAGLVKKMYGQSVFTDEVLRTVEKELNTYLGKEQLDIFAQPLPLDNDARALDMNNPADYAFAFEIGLKPEISINADDLKVTRYKVVVTDQMVNEEVERLQTRHGNMTEPESVTGDDNVLNVNFIESDAAGNAVEGGITKDNSLLVKYFAEATRPKLIGLKKDDTLVINLNEAFEGKERETIAADLGLGAGDTNRFFKLVVTKVGFVEKAALDENFFKAVYPNNEITSEADFRETLKAEIGKYYDQQARNQVHDQIYHILVDHTNLEFPETFLKKWLQTGGEKPKTAEEAEKEYPVFANQLKWTLISSKLIADNEIQVTPEDIKDFAKQQLFGYMGMSSLGGDDQPWIEEYVNRMMKDQKYVEDSYHRISTEKLFAVLESKAKATEEPISAEAFAEKLHHHHH